MLCSSLMQFVLRQLFLQLLCHCHAALLSITSTASPAVLCSVCMLVRPKHARPECPHAPHLSARCTQGPDLLASKPDGCAAHHHVVRCAVMTVVCGLVYCCHYHMCPSMAHVTAPSAVADSTPCECWLSCSGSGHACSTMRWPPPWGPSMPP